MKKITIIIFTFVLMSGVLSGCSSSVANKTYYFDKDGNMSTSKPVEAKSEKADKLEVYYFHRTARCVSCETIGQYTRELMSEKYSQQIKDGLIDFRELNVELTENKEIANKFKASGSSLFINRIIENVDNIEQENKVWQLLNNETNFKNYLETKIDSYLGL